MDYQEMYKRLMKGESAETLANELSTMLNKAQKDAEAQQEKERLEQERKEREETARVEKENHLNELAEKMAGLLDGYMRIYAPDLVAEAEKNGEKMPLLDAKEVREIADSVFDGMDHLKNVKIKFHVPKDIKNLDDVFATFFKELGI